MTVNYTKIIIITITIISMSACSGIHHQKTIEPFDGFTQTNLFLSDLKLNDEIKEINAVDDLSLDQPDEADDRIFNLLLELLGEKTGGKNQDDINQLKKKFLNVDPDDKFGKIRPSLINFLSDLEDSKYHSTESRERLKFDQGKIRSAIKGIGGFNSYLALNGIVACHRLGRIQAVKFGEQRFYGTIEGYAYNKNTSEGYIGFRTIHVIDCKDGLTPISNEYFMHIVVQKDKTKKTGGFEVFGIEFEGKKMNLIGKGRNNIDREALFPDPVKKHIKRRGLDYKLHAGHPSIKMLAAFKDGKLLDSDHVIYERDDESCIDILFAGPPPAYKLPRQIDYCLGRCSDPPIINSGS